MVESLGSLAAALRAQGSRVGVGELLAAHRALAAVDCSSREDSRLALRTALCSDRIDMPRFDLAFQAVFGSGEVPLDHNPLEELGSVARAALPHAAIPGGGASEPPAAEDPTPLPAAWSDVELLREKDFATYTEAEMAVARVLIARLADAGRPGSRAGRGRFAAAAATTPTCAVWFGHRCGPWVSPCSGTGAPRAGDRAPSSWCATYPDR